MRITYIVYVWQKGDPPSYTTVTRDEVIADYGDDEKGRAFADLIDSDIRTKGFYDDSDPDHEPTCLYLPGATWQAHV